MKIAFYSKSDQIYSNPEIVRMKRLLEQKNIEYEVVNERLNGDVDFLVSIGGDGTLLSSVHLVGGAPIPIVGINFGHLGFLTTAGVNDIETLIEDLKTGSYELERRTLLQAAIEGDCRRYVALNEVAIHRAAEVLLLQTQLYVDNHLVATYMGDGLIVATPTGSTAYSLSCGGPILTPDSGCFVITPIAAHSLSLRPLVVPDSAKIQLVTDMREGSFTLSTDSSKRPLAGGTRVEVERGYFDVQLVRMRHQTFFSAMQEKLHWGEDNCRV